MEWYGWLLFVLIIILVVVFLIVIYYFRKRKLNGISVENLVKAEEKLIEIQKETEKKLNTKLKDLEVTFSNRLVLIEEIYTKRMKVIEQEKVELYENLKNNPNDIDSWLDTKLSTSTEDKTNEG